MINTSYWLRIANRNCSASSIDDDLMTTHRLHRWVDDPDTQYINGSYPANNYGENLELFRRDVQQVFCKILL